MPVFTCKQYFEARIPDIATLLPGWNTDMAINAAMALYWSQFFPDETNGQLVEESLTERQKVLVALRAVVGAIPVVMKLISKPQVIEAVGGPASTKFEERSKILKQLLALWQEELKMLEGAEGISFEVLANVPAYLKAIGDLNDQWSDGYIVSRGVYYVKE